MNTLEIHSTLIDLVALSGLLAEAMDDRCVHENDAGRPDLGAVADVLHRELARLRDAVEAAQDRRGAAT